MDEQPGLFDVTDRRCGSCGTVRPIDMFYLAYEKRRGAKRGGRALGSCRICIREKNQRRLAPRYEILDRIKTEAGCADCGIRDTEHPEIYDFDHLPEFHKVNPVAWFLTHGTIEDMLAEVAKCARTATESAPDGSGCRTHSASTVARSAGPHRD
jgi:hypothetical protein